MEGIKKLIGQDVHCSFVSASGIKDAILYIHKHDSEILYDKTLKRTEQGHIVLDTLKAMREGKSEREVIEMQPSLAYRPGTVAYLQRLASEDIAQ